MTDKLIKLNKKISDIIQAPLSHPLDYYGDIDLSHDFVHFGGGEDIITWDDIQQIIMRRGVFDGYYLHWLNDDWHLLYLKPVEWGYVD